MMLERRGNPMCDTTGTGEVVNVHTLYNSGEWQENDAGSHGLLDIIDYPFPTDSNGKPQHVIESLYTGPITGFLMVINSESDEQGLREAWMVPLVNCKKDWFVQHGECIDLDGLEGRPTRIRVMQRAVKRSGQGGRLESRVEFLDFALAPQSSIGMFGAENMARVTWNPPCKCEENREP